MLDDATPACVIGVGFKVVFSFTNSPYSSLSPAFACESKAERANGVASYIYCDTACFKIENFLEPVEIKDTPIRQAGKTLFIFPFNSDRISSSAAHRLIEESLDSLNLTSLLFTNTINKIYCRYKEGYSKGLERVEENNKAAEVSYVVNAPHSLLFMQDC